MSIPSQLPQFVTAARPGALQALALQSGQVLDARIVGPAPNGGTQVEIRGQMLNLVLPTLVAAGQTIKLEVQGAGQQMRLALQVATAPHTNSSQSSASCSSAFRQYAAAGQHVVATGWADDCDWCGKFHLHPRRRQPYRRLRRDACSGQQRHPLLLPTRPRPPYRLPDLAGAGPPTAPAPAAIYPQAASPALPNPLAAAVAATAVNPAAPPLPVAMPGAVRPVVPATASANANAHSAPGNPSAQAQPQQPATPQAALAQMVQAAVPRQGSVTALTTALASIAGKVVLPEPVARAAQQVLAGRISIDGARFDGNALQAALRGSGVFQEAGLARGAQTPLQQPDMKSSLLALRQTLTTWLGQQAPVAAVMPIPPPLRGITPRARAGAPPPIDPGAAPEEVGKQLLERTDSALARIRLHQHASLPDPTGRTAELSMDLPVMVGTHQTLMQFQIHRDQHNEGDATAERGWQMRFALNLPGMGEVGAQVTLRAGAVGVMLWASEPAASAALEAEVAGLRESLAAAGLHPGAVIVRHGEPPAPPAAASGHFVDSRS